MLSALALSAQSAESLTFALHNHPVGEGGASPPPYGLRLDNLGGEEGVYTFDFDDHRASGVIMTYDGGTNSILIQGSVYGGLNSNTGYANADSGMVGIWDFDFIYTANVTALGTSGDPSSFSLLVDPKDKPGNFGIISLRGSETAFNLTEDPSLNMGGTTFIFDADGYRITGDTTTFVGRAWLDETPDTRTGYQELLFTAVLIPEPSGLTLLGLASLVGLCVRHRRQS